jgi:hypothetical protein
MGYRLKGIRMFDREWSVCLEVGGVKLAGGKIIKAKLGRGERIVGVISR